MTISDPIKATATETGVKLAPLAPASPPVTPSAGEDGFRALVPIAEPLSQGEPPLSPSRVESAGSAWAVRRQRLACGLMATSPTDTAQRVTYRLSWSGVSRPELDALRAFFDDTCDAGRLAFTVYPDGRDGSAVFLRAFGPIASALDDARAAGIGDGSGGLHSFDMAAEEVRA